MRAYSYNSFFLHIKVGQQSFGIVSMCKLFTVLHYFYGRTNAPPPDHGGGCRLRRDLALSLVFVYSNFQLKFSSYFLCLNFHICIHECTEPPDFVTFFLKFYLHGSSFHILPRNSLFVENWNYRTNSLFVADREMSISLLEVKALVGLPIYIWCALPRILSQRC